MKFLYAEVKNTKENLGILEAAPHSAFYTPEGSILRYQTKLVCLDVFAKGYVAKTYSTSRRFGGFLKEVITEEAALNFIQNTKHNKPQPDDHQNVNFRYGLTRDEITLTHQAVINEVEYQVSITGNASDVLALHKMLLEYMDENRVVINRTKFDDAIVKYTGVVITKIDPVESMGYKQVMDTIVIEYLNARVKGSTLWTTFDRVKDDVGVRTGTDYKTWGCYGHAPYTYVIRGNDYFYAVGCLTDEDMSSIDATLKEIESYPNFVQLARQACLYIR